MLLAPVSPTPQPSYHPVPLDSTVATVATSPLEELQEDISNDLGYYQSNSPGYDSHIPPTFMHLPNAGISCQGRNGTNPHNPPQSVGNDWATTLIGSWPISMWIDIPGGVPHNPMSKEWASLLLTQPHLPDVEAVRWCVNWVHSATTTRCPPEWLVEPGMACLFYCSISWAFTVQ